MESWERIGPGRLVELESWRVVLIKEEEKEKDNDQDDKEDNEKRRFVRGSS